MTTWGLHRCLGALLAESEPTWFINEGVRWTESQSFTLELAEEPQGIELLSFHSANNVTINTVESK